MQLSPIVIEKFKNSKNILALTGAGISAESGVPTFRGKEGLWKQYRAEELATPQAFHRDPGLVWEWYIWRMELISTKSPNPAHYALVELEKKRSNFHLITQNVDGLHKKSGSEKIIEIHGNIFRNKCVRCAKMYESVIPELRKSTECPNCKSLVRPDVLWFGENYDTDLLNRAIFLAERSEIVFVIGSSGAVGIPVELARVAKENDAFVVEINIDPSGYSRYADLFLQGKAGEILPELIHYFS
ncbi:SIR2 family NAD-dependent protein deacylase [Leptospira licerasiae]|uniref:NAD-dependent protein deacylase n=1 Tax=Leptospira licerasiae str. MMD4847 TaxID=1049971 RepID=A0ABP2RES7_9LEPT|nr:NAD-dependent deacylase [Leptospira licerasiae]EID99872.1 transcriptional regulator, Sir2 family [Leptospira licerasiae serovar Varillal str. VAR 010]EJZ42005.1 transcriptional regulator, Sir2 family [Leptospira licerasiae str. MMD4847]